MAAHPTQALATFASTLEYDRIPERAREYTKDLLLDAFACAIAGDRGEETHQVEAFVSALAQSSESSIIGGDHASIADIRLAATLEFLAAIDYELPGWAKDYIGRMEKDLGAAYAEPAADVRGYIGWVRSQ